MASTGGIKAIIAAQFNDAGLKKAQKEFGNLGKSIKGALGAVGLAVGIGAITQQLTAAGKAAAADAKGQALLATQLRNTANATTSQIANTESFIQKLQMQTSVLDDELRPAMASLVRATGDVSSAQSLLALATDVSAATGKDLQSVSLALGKAVSGQTTALFRMIPGLKGSSDWMSKLQQETKGAAATAANADPFTRLSVVFNDIQEQIGMALLPTLQELANWFASTEGQAAIADFVQVIKDAIGWLVKVVDAISANIDWLGPFVIAIGAATVAWNLFNLALNANPIMLAVKAVLLLAGAVATLDNVAASKIAAIPNTVINAADAAGQKAYDAAMRNAKREQTSTGPGNILPGEMAKADRLRMQAYNEVIGRYKSQQQTLDKSVADAVTKLPDLPTLPGLTTPTGSKAATDAQKAADAAAKAAMEAADKLAQAYMDAVAAGNKLIAETNKVMASFTDLFKIQPELGAFEQTAVDAFTSVFDTIESALADGTILSDAASRLREYATSERTTLQAIAKQRDILAGKIDVARTITSGVMGLLNITNLLETTSKTITETVTTISNGISLATTKTFDVVTSGGLVDNFQKLVDKTKAFAKNLIDLKKLGLNKQLFAQLVNAGADAGSATAQALVDGGAETIGALNDLYSQLAMSAGDIASTATDTLYEVGQQVVSNGFIEGLLSQDTALQQAAQTLADAFASTFTSQLQLAVDAALPDVNALGGQVSNLTGGGGGGGMIGGGALLRAASVGGGTVYNVNVSAGVVTDPNSLARTVIDSVKKYERSNGSVWVAA